MEQKQIQELMGQMTLEEKASLCAGADFWHLRGIDRLGIPQVMVTDGPHGLRKQVASADHLGLNASETAICFPAGCALASSFDPELAKTLGTELGKLAQAEDVSTVLGPAMNIKRSPLCGRNFEYYSEDPLVSSSIAAGTIEGVQSQNVGACPKHFLANNQEYFRMTSNSVVDEKTLRELYLASFEGAVKAAKPWTLMCSYNRINGTYACENKTYLTDILRDEWGFDGYVMTDWGACDDPVDSLAAGLDLEMPGPGNDNVKRICEAVQSGRLDEALVNQAVERILTIVMRYVENHDANAVYDFANGHESARRIEAESAVLLKNEDHVLPLNEAEHVAIIGKYAKAPRYQGGGSSHINPYKVSSVWDAIGDLDTVSYAEGFVEKEAVTEEEVQQEAAMIQEAVAMAKKADKAVIFAGLPDAFESEGFDRKKLDMPQGQNRLIEAVAAVQPNTIVVLHNGSPVTMPWLGDVKGVLEMYLGGEAVGLAAADILYGKANPCGRLAETFPLRLEDTPAYPYYGVEKDDVVYRECSLVGYRYYETMKKNVLFPFGYGLSYTTFAYDNLNVSKTEFNDTEEITVTVDVTNTGKMAGKEVVQLYVAADSVDEVRPVRELRGFKKVALEAGETKTVSLTLSKRSFAQWNTAIHDWYVTSGTYKLQVGTCASDMVLEKEVTVTSTAVPKVRFTVNSPMGDMMKHPVAGQVLMQAMAPMMGSMGVNKDEMSEGSDIMSAEAMQAMAAAMPLRALLSFSPDAKLEQMEQLVNAINQAIENA